MKLFTPTTIAIGILTPICLLADVLPAAERTVAAGKRSTQLATFDFGVKAQDVHLWPQIKDKAGNFYGTTMDVGQHGRGIIFKVTPQDDVTILARPTRPVISLFAPKGEFLYGVAHPPSWMPGQDSENQTKAILKFSSDGKESLFAELPDKALLSVGGRHQPLVMSKAGDFFGCTQGDGVSGCGTVFKVNSKGVLSTVVEFTGEGGTAPGNMPVDLIAGNSGSVFGITREGGRNNDGTIFEISGNGVFSTLAEFGVGELRDSYPKEGLFADAKGNVYGSSTMLIFRISSEGTVSKHAEIKKAYSHEFAQGADGAILFIDGINPALKGGTLMQISRDGAVTKLAEFPNEFMGATMLTVDENGFIYGISQHYDSQTKSKTVMIPGLLFKVSPKDGKLTTVLQGDLNTYGFWPAGFANGKLYGVSLGDKGTVFSLPAAKR